jgi:anti-sigma regulatory factor (Ser/Thr protein kinase)
VFIEVTDSSQVAQARRLIGDFGRDIGFSQERIDRIAIVVTELATNLVKHGGGGHIHARQFDDAGGAGLELLALDRGKGMADVSRCMEDGYSTAGSPGNGLGAIRRLADDMRVYSRSDLGSAIMVRILQRPAGNQRGVLLGAVIAPYPGERVSGDGWSFIQSKAGPTIMLVDGAGHGVEAARAAKLAADIFASNAAASCEAIVATMHSALSATRGAVVGVARIDVAARIVRFVGIGNITARLILTEESRHMVSHNGTMGHVAPRIREFTYPFTGDPLVILHSDGLTTRWSHSAYPGLAGQHPSLIAGVLLRDHRRGRDDASVVAMRGLI